MTPRARLTAFVTDGDQRPALAITRSLGRRGIAVIVGAEQPETLASRSKYCAGRVTYPSPVNRPDAFERFLLEFVERERIDVIMPVTDVTTHLVAKHAGALNRFCATAVPPFEAFDFVNDKAALASRAIECGLCVPRTHFVQCGSALNAVLHQVQYPAVVRPSRSRIRTRTGWLGTTVSYARDEAELLKQYREVEYLAAYPSMIQERIDGPGTGVFVLCDRGRLRAAFAHRRLREKPPSGGASVLSESVDVDPMLLDQAMRVLGPLAWHGVAMMEFKQDRRTGRSFLMEINGRFWGSLQLAIDAGVDFPYLSWQLALGQSPAAPPPYHVGVKSRWLLGDLDHLIIRLFHERGDQNLAPGTPSRARAVLNFLQPVARRMRYDVISAADPRPFLHEAREYAKHATAAPARTARRWFARAPQPTVHVTAVK
jgi:predicted ATP-grasp superfamily ATP-dependent carboligase